MKTKHCSYCDFTPCRCSEIGERIRNSSSITHYYWMKVDEIVAFSDEQKKALTLSFALATPAIHPDFKSLSLLTGTAGEMEIDGNDWEWFYRDEKLKDEL